MAPPEPPFGAASPHRILVVKLSSFGDIVLSTAGLCALRRAFPSADLRVAVEKRWAPVLAASPVCDGVVEAPDDPALDARGILAIVRRLAAERRARGPFDLALDFQGTRRSGAWIYLSRARIRAGRGHPRPGWRFALPMDRTKHAVRTITEVCERIGVATEGVAPALRTLDADEAALDAILAREALPQSGFVLLNPASRWPSKSWAAARAAELAARLSRQAGETVIVTGGAAEAETAHEIARRAGPDVVSLAGRLMLGEALCLYRRARLMISCDSGPMHAAAALGTTVVALFGPTLPDHTGPWGGGHRVVQAMRPPDHHAYRRSDGESYMDALDVGTVAHAVFDALRAVPQRPASAR